MHDVMAAVDEFIARGGRMLGLAGPPGVGKTTLADRIVSQVGASAVVVGLDGFHIGQSQLEELGRADRKGAPDTFDAEGYRVMLERIRRADAPVYAPRFDRSIEASLAAEIVVRPDHRLVVTEGNYLLVDDDVWRPVREQLDECWYVHTDDSVRRARLVQRHIEHGRTPDDAEEWVARSDDVNAALVVRCRRRSDRTVVLDST